MADKPITRLKFYITIWLIMSKNSFLSVLMQKKILVIFLVGKVVRFIFFLVFLHFLLKGSNGLAGYSANQTIFFFLSFVVVDTVAQFLFREVYRFRPLVVSGDFDLIMLKPMNPLFRVLLGGADVIDLITLPPLVAAIIFAGSQLGASVGQVLLYFLLLTAGFIIATAFHIFVLALGILTLEIDHTVMIYRDLTAMGRFPVDIYRQPIRGILTYFLPIGLIMTLPVKALLGVAPLGLIIYALILAGVSLAGSLKFWQFALKRYTSASS